ncbi:ABC transporter substrate-binding protein [Chloroflexi bacterium TSY]|nr:ABC transporter substrate-binding protein [Chloroflexi bacterium TSY]
MNRRTPLVTILLMFTLLLSACGGAAPAAEETAPDAADQSTEQTASESGESEAAAPAAPGTYNESPMLAEQVSAGTLPPVDERLPQEPLVIEPVEETGQYGGTWRAVDSDSLGWTRQTIMVEPFLKWERDVNGMRPNLLESWEWNEDATELVVHFRKGIRWSDGEPLTADDYLFWWNDMVLNEDVPVGPPGGTTVGGQAMQVEKVDDFSLKYTFAAPNPLFLENHSRGHYHSSAFVVPSHYLEQFHPAYNDVVEDANDLVDRYNVGSRLHYPDMPTFNAWMLVEYQSGQRAVFERNPYYWKVDSAGNQLPYIDRMEVEITEGNPTELVALKAIAGELDIQVRDLSLQDVPLVMENAEAGDYRVIMWNRGDYAWPWLILMYDYPDEGIVDLMYTQAFRQALSHAIDRDRINNIAALGLAKARQFALSPESPEFQSESGRATYEAWESSYANHDPAQAESLLDEIGVVDADGDGWRDRPDGTELELIVDMIANDTKTVDSMDLVKEDWETIGLKTALNPIAGDVMNQRAQAGEIMIRAWGSAAAWGLISAATVWTPVEGVTYALGGVRIGQSYVNADAENAVEPRPGSMLEKLQDAYTELVSTVDPAEREAKLLEAYQIHIDEGPISIGTVGEHVSPVIVKNNVRNVQDTGLVAGWDLGFPGSADPEQFFFAE